MPSRWVASRTNQNVGEMAAAIHEVAKTAQEADRISQRAKEDAQTGDEAGARTVDGIRKLSDTMEHTARVITGLGKRSHGCQLMAELGLLYPHHKKTVKLLHNKSNKFESCFIGVKVPENKSVMLGNMSGMELGIWVAHGEGQFNLPYSEDQYHVVLKFSKSTYPANPNGSDFDIAGLCSDDGRHLVMMPHLERAYFPWQCGYYPSDTINDDIPPWIKAFINARQWIEARLSTGHRR